jgi:hypothetical protein
MHPEPWPSAQHLPVIALAIILCAALVAATLLTSRLRLGQVREADTRKAQIGALKVRIGALEAGEAIIVLNGNVSIPGKLTVAGASTDDQRIDPLHA